MSLPVKVEKRNLDCFASPDLTQTKKCRTHVITAEKNINEISFATYRGIKIETAEEVIKNKQVSASICDEIVESSVIEESHIIEIVNLNGDRIGFSK